MEKSVFIKSSWISVVPGIGEPVAMQRGEPPSAGSRLKMVMPVPPEHATFIALPRLTPVS
ncbi:MAG: hypothetical protein ACRDMY_02550 [Gaiellaceae bacterium]